MNFDHQAVSTTSGGCKRHGGHQSGLAGCVAGIDYNGQMAQFMQNRDRGQILSVAGVCLVGADATLAENDILIALTHDVFSAHEQLL